MERTYTDEQLAGMDNPPFEYEGKTYDQYQASQQQRKIERTIRKLKREQIAFEAAGLKDEATAVKVRMRILNGKYNEFSKAAGLPTQKERLRVLYVDEKATVKAVQTKQKAVEKIAKQWKIPSKSVTIEPSGTARIKVPNSQLKNGLPITGRANSVVDKTDDDGAVLQRRVYGADGRAAIDFDTSDHSLPHRHPTGAHKHRFNYQKKNPRGTPEPLTEQELVENNDIIRRGENYHDQTGMD